MYGYVFCLHVYPHRLLYVEMYCDYTMRNIYHVLVFVFMYFMCTPMSAHMYVHEDVYVIWPGQKLCPSHNLRPLGPWYSLPVLCLSVYVVLSCMNFPQWQQTTSFIPLPTYPAVKEWRRLRSPMCVSQKVALIQDRMGSELRPRVL